MAPPVTPNGAKPNDFSDVPQSILLAADFLRSGKAKMRSRDGILHESRVDYFKGKSAMKALSSDAYKAISKDSASKTDANHPPLLKTDEEVADLLSSFLFHGLVIRVEREAPKSRTLKPVSSQTFAADSYYVWLYQGSQFYRVLFASAIILVVLAGVMFPLWPYQLRVGVWYLSVTLLIILGIFFAMVIVRAILWGVTYLVFRGRGFWLFPNLFEDVSIVESFKPVYGWDPPPVSKGSKNKKSAAADSGAEQSERVDEGADGDVSASGAER